MSSHHRARAFPVDVQISNEKLLSCLLDLRPVVSVYGARQSIFAVVGQLQSVIEIPRLRNRQHRPENLFLKQPVRRFDIGNHRRPDEISFVLQRFSTRHQTPFQLSRLNVFQNRFLCPGIDHRPQIKRRIIGRPHCQSSRFPRQYFQKFVVHLCIDNRPRTGGTFLPLIPKRRLQHPGRRPLHIRIAIDDDCVLAAHLRHHPPDPNLTLLRFRR